MRHFTLASAELISNPDSLVSMVMTEIHRQQDRTDEKNVDNKKEHGLYNYNYTAYTIIKHILL